MILRVALLVIIACLIPAVTGCGHAHHVCRPLDARSECPTTVAEVTGPRNLQPDVRLPSYDGKVPVQYEPLEYVVLSAPACQCTAANNAAIANMLHMEAQLAEWSARHKGSDHRRILLMQRDLLRARSVEKRNTAAGLAMRAFFELSGVEAQAQLLVRGIQEIKITIRRAKQLREGGLAEEIDLSALVGQHLQLEERFAKLRLNRLNLNAALRKLLDCPLNQQAFIWPETQLVAEPALIDIDFEVARGLDLRPELRSLRFVYHNLDAKTLPIVRGVLQAADSGLGSVTKTHGLGLIETFGDPQEVAVRDQQLLTLMHDTEQLVTAELRRAVHTIAMTRHYIALASAKVASRRTRLERLDVLRSKGAATAIDIGMATLQLYEAEAEVVQQVVALRVAEIELKAAQGLLALECGYEAMFCCD